MIREPLAAALQGSQAPHPLAEALQPLQSQLNTRFGGMFSGLLNNASFTPMPLSSWQNQVNTRFPMFGNLVADVSDRMGGGLSYGKAMQPTGQPSRSVFPVEDEMARRDQAVREYQRIFGTEGAMLSPVERSNAMTMIMRNFGKWKSDPLSDKYIREHATNPPGRFGSIDMYREISTR